MELPRSSLDALWHAFTPTGNPTREDIEDLRVSGIVWLLPRRPRHRLSVQEAEDATSALEALARLRLVSYSAWLAVVEDQWPSQMKRLRQWVQTQKKLELGLEYCPTSRTWFCRSYDHFLQSHTPTNEAKGVTDYSGVAIPVRLVLKTYRNKRESPDLVHCMKACEGIEAVRARFSHEGTDSECQLIPLYRFMDVKIDLASKKYFWAPADILLAIRRFAACGVRVLVPLRPDSTWFGRDVVDQGISLMQDVLETTATRHQLTKQFCGASHVHVSLVYDSRLRERVFSAIMMSQSLHEITATTASNWHRGGHDRAWLWLAVVLRRTAGIDAFTLDCQGLAMEDLHILEYALGVPNPLSLLFPSTMIPVDGTEDAFVASAKCFRLYPLSMETLREDGIMTTLSYDSPLENLPVISVDEDWVTVLLPGWGRAWVSHRDVSLSSMEQESCRTCCGLRRLSLTNLQSDQEPVVLALLRLIGSHVRTISISPSQRSTRSVSATPFLEIIMQACPNVNKLRIKEMSLPTLSIVSRAYEGHVLRAEHLILENIDIEDRADCDQFFYSLADRDHSMACQLRTFSCTINGRADSFPSIKPAILRTFQHNHRLGEFQLDLGDHCDLRTEEVIHQEEVDFLNQERLPLRRKLALLSVMNADEEHSCKRAKTDRIILARQLPGIRWLDRDVLTTIFAFASRGRFLRVQYCGVQVG